MSQTMKALIKIREFILSGALAPGERLFEVSLVEQLGVSRTPIRAALIKLAEEGLLEKRARGYMIRAFTEQDIEDAIEMRGTIEGFAARLAAERSVNPHAMQQLKDCLAEMDCALQKEPLCNEDIGDYFELNDQFHDHLIRLADSFVVDHMIQRIVMLPFASPNSFVMMPSEQKQVLKQLYIAQEQHRDIVEAIECHRGARAEIVAREHARLSFKRILSVVRERATLDKGFGSTLIQIRP